MKVFVFPSDFLKKIGEVFWIFQWNFLYFSVIFFGFLYDIFLIFWWIVLDFLVKILELHGLSARRGPGVRTGGLEVGAQQAPRLLIV